MHKFRGLLYGKVLVVDSGAEYVLTDTMVVARPNLVAGFRRLIASASRLPDVRAAWHPDTSLLQAEAEVTVSNPRIERDIGASAPASANLCFRTPFFQSQRLQNSCM